MNSSRFVLVLVISLIIGLCHGGYNYPLHNQCDSRWASTKLSCGNTICRNGSFITSLSMALTGTAAITHFNAEPFPQYTPLDIMNYIQSHPQYSRLYGKGLSSNIVNPAFVESLSSYITYNTQLDYNPSTSSPVVTMDICASINQDDSFYLADTLFSHYDEQSAVVLLVSCTYRSSSNTFDITAYHPRDGVITTTFTDLVHLHQFFVAYNSQEKNHNELRTLSSTAAALMAPLPTYPAIPVSSQVVPFPYNIYFSQCDPLWGDDFMVTLTICQVGCLMNSVAVGLRGHGVFIDNTVVTPKNLNQLTRDYHGYTEDNNFLHDTVSYICDTSTISPCSAVFAEDGMHRTNDLDLATLQYYFRQNRVMVAAVKNGGHFVLAYGWDATEPSHILTRDSAGSTGREWYPMEEIVGWRIYDMVGIYSNQTRSNGYADDTIVHNHHHASSPSPPPSSSWLDDLARSVGLY